MTKKRLVITNDMIVPISSANAHVIGCYARNPHTNTIEENTISVVIITDSVMHGKHEVMFTLDLETDKYKMNYRHKID